ncbi:hypothetical protein D3C80_1830670 [compost metagenome]
MSNLLPHWVNALLAASPPEVKAPSPVQTLTQPNTSPTTEDGITSVATMPAIPVKAETVPSPIPRMASGVAAPKVAKLATTPTIDRAIPRMLCQEK